MSSGEPIDSDLTTKARIRNAALELFAAEGVSAVSMRAVAARAGVAVGLVQHHFKTKDGLRSAVEQYIVDRHAAAIASVPGDGAPAEVAAARDGAVRRMLDEHPALIGYMRRALLDPSGDGRLLERLTDLSRNQVIELRTAGAASTSRPVADQVVGLMVRQLGHLFLQPMIDAMWAQLDTEKTCKPQLIVRASANVGAPEGLRTAEPS
ncbi:MULTISPECIES: TetR/AcrR family transcriptional regulator [Mycobacteriales]|jgi:AcrR family transcriptional regulator|uniref:TetR/AcrR family transcriptional regulator n=1 Tax=Gordonia rubripertincta TaxID=36822 RepID=A0AAW4GBV4_GORRU|nr:MULTISPECIES: TetR/AcrR family transcriptional regulator [Mycobacteriales]MAU83076.1 TetR family transcriptional regulator [Gordonia sp. (in: high G+C Gram-positive bacteria)]MBF6541238.1 TetR/AcrR family transcriptional regulator [Nocardia farcinica]MBM7280595.1 TetR/AcrR family transcriptional regulator [Gordonia rubripertincta]MBR7193751.1 TetR/AcrR family transcriptional regulator [Gordonia sp. SCSIO 19800]MCR8897634.1 TetR/AcrR family transcriptional regulator [Gordonia sp. GONU]